MRKVSILEASFCGRRLSDTFVMAGNGSEEDSRLMHQLGFAQG